MIYHPNQYSQYIGQIIDLFGYSKTINLECLVYKYIYAFAIYYGVYFND